MRRAAVCWIRVRQAREKVAARVALCGPQPAGCVVNQTPRRMNDVQARRIRCPDEAAARRAERADGRARREGQRGQGRGAGALQERDGKAAQAIRCRAFQARRDQGGWRGRLGEDGRRNGQPARRLQAARTTTSSRRSETARGCARAGAEPFARVGAVPARHVRKDGRPPASTRSAAGRWVAVRTRPLSARRAAHPGRASADPPHAPPRPQGCARAAAGW